MTKELSRTQDLASRLVHELLKTLAEHGGEMPARDAINAVGERVELDDWARATYEKTGYIRWESTLLFYTINLVKAGWLIKRKRVWYLTPEGETAISLSEHDLLDRITTAYKEWRAERKSAPAKNPNIPDDSEDLDHSERIQEIGLQDIEQRAADGIRSKIQDLNPYEMQDLVAALLRGMGYFTPFIAPKGRDGGVDVIAHQDPLGANHPRIKVQVKHRESPATVQEIRELAGLLGKDGDIGMFVSTGGFTKDAKDLQRTTHVHIETIDIDRFASLWQEFYARLQDEDKELQRLKAVYIYDPAL